MLPLAGGVDRFVHVLDQVKGIVNNLLAPGGKIAFKRAQKLKGAADAEATIIYAEAYGKDPEFYSFVQSLEIYREALGKDNTLILSTDSEFLKYLKGDSK